MATYSTTGIVLRRHNLGEADRIITFLTPEYGKVRAVAKGVRRIKSRMAGHLELFSRSQLMLAEGRNLDIVTSARLQHFGAGSTDNYDRLRLSYLAAEMLEKLTDDEGVPQPDLFMLAASLYEALEAAPSFGWLELSFKLKLADSLGYRPELGQCMQCGSGSSDREYFFSPTLGGIIDSSCKTGLESPMSHKEIKLWRHIITSRGLSQTPPSDTEREITSGLATCNTFFDHLFGRRFKSDQFLHLRPV